MRVILFSALILFFAASVSSQQQDEKYLTSMEVDQKVVIISKPRAKSLRSCREDTGSVVLRVYFHKSESIAKVEIFKPSTCSDFDASSIEAANKIKFKAAVKNGQPASYVTSVVYDWRRY